MNLALVEDGHVTLAVVGDPSTDEIQVAERGRGAWALKDSVRRALTTSDESRTIVIEDGKSSAARREHAALHWARLQPLPQQTLSGGACMG